MTRRAIMADLQYCLCNVDENNYLDFETVVAIVKDVVWCTCKWLLLLYIGIVGILVVAAANVNCCIVHVLKYK